MSVTHFYDEERFSGMENKSIHGAGVIVFRLQPDESMQFLLLRAKWGERNWGFPKGHREKKDVSLIKCAMREMQEETGINERDLIPTKGFRHDVVYKMPQPTKRIPNGIKNVVLFAAEVVNFDQEIILSSEHEECLWFAEATAKSVLPDTYSAALQALVLFRGRTKQ